VSSDSISPFDREGMYDLRKRAIMREAGRQFARNGFRSTSLEDIAKSLNLTKAGLYHYVDTKEQLLFDCYLDSLDAAERCVLQVAKEGTSGLDKVCRYVRSVFSMFDRPEGFFALLTEVSALGEEHQKVLRRKGRVVDHVLRGFIEEGMQDGSIRKVDPALIEFAIQGALNWIPKWYSSKGRKDVNQIIEDYVDFFTYGLKPR
jgi:TetR/AcrR family transcriptional regulator